MTPTSGDASGALAAAAAVGIVITGDTPAKAKERTAHVAAVTRRQALRLGSPYPGPPCLSDRRDAGDNCMRCPLATQVDRHVVCAIDGPQTPEDVLARNIKAKRPPPPCYRGGWWAQTHHGRFEGGISLVNVFCASGPA